MGDKLFLVSGASGSVGAKMVRILLERGHKVRAMVHKEDERSEELKQQGAETLICDFLDLKGLRLALIGVSGAYFGYPVAPRIVEAAAFFAQAAKETHVEIIVNMSQASARGDAFSDTTIDHWVSEHIFNWSGVKTTHIRPTFFFDWFLYFAKGAQVGQIQMPFDRNKIAFVSPEDVAHVAVKIFENPSEYQGETYTLYGPEQYSFEEAYQKISQVLNHKIKYEIVSVEAWADGLKDFLPPRVIQHFRNGPSRDLPSGIFKGPVETLQLFLDHKPITLAEFVNDHRDVLSASGSSATGYSVG